MKPASFDYERAQSLQDAVDRLASDPEARLLAGGQSLIPMLAMRLARPSLLVDISRLPELRSIACSSDDVTIGATTRHREIEASSLIQSTLPLLRDAISHVGHPPIRALGTVGGSLAHADPAAEIPLLAVTLGATLSIVTANSTQRIPANEFFLGPMLTAMPDAGCLVDIRFPLQHLGDLNGSAILEVSTRRSDFALVAVAAQVTLDEDLRFKNINFGIAGVGDYPTRLDLDDLIGIEPSGNDLLGVLEKELEEVEAIDDLHASASYRLRAARTLGVRALESAFRDAASARG